MADEFKGKSIEAVAKDIAEGYVFVSPIFLKRFSREVLIKLLAATNKATIMIRNEKFPTGDVNAIKKRNVRLSRLNNANMVIKHFAKERRWII